MSIYRGTYRLGDCGVVDAVSTSTGVAAAAAGDVDIVRLNFWVARERGRDENELREQNWRECSGVVAVVRWEESRREQRRRRSFDILGPFLRFWWGST